MNVSFFSFADVLTCIELPVTLSVDTTCATTRRACASTRLTETRASALRTGPTAPLPTVSTTCDNPSTTRESRPALTEKLVTAMAVCSTDTVVAACTTRTETPSMRTRAGRTLPLYWPTTRPIFVSVRLDYVVKGKCTPIFSSFLFVCIFLRGLAFLFYGLFFTSQTLT